LLYNQQKLSLVIKKGEHKLKGLLFIFLVTSIIMCLFVSSVKHGQQGQTAIITGKKTSKKYYDKSGNLVTDKDLIDLIQQGANLISYHEQMPSGAKDTQYDKRNRTLIRSRSKK
jgi:hypothetical protein